VFQKAEEGVGGFALSSGGCSKVKDRALDAQSSELHASESFCGEIGAHGELGDDGDADAGGDSLFDCLGAGEGQDGTESEAAGNEGALNERASAGAGLTGDAWFLAKGLRGDGAALSERMPGRDDGDEVIVHEHGALEIGRCGGDFGDGEVQFAATEALLKY